MLRDCDGRLTYHLSGASVIKQHIQQKIIIISINSHLPKFEKSSTIKLKMATKTMTNSRSDQYKK